MQIVLNSNDIQAAIIARVQGLVNLEDDQSLQIDLIDDGTAVVTILSPGEEAPVTEGTQSGGDKPKRGRRTKAQIEADKLAEEQAQREQEKGLLDEDTAGNEEPTQTTSVEVAKPTVLVPVEDAGETNLTEEEPVGEAEPQVNPQLDEPAVVVEEKPETEPTPVPVAKPSLFANLRKPNNQQN